MIFIFIMPELYSLYTQFDLHPEKVVFGRTNVSGIRFFFWDSQFGRFFNTGPIKGHGDPAFFLHTTLWAFLPWSAILYIAVIHLIRKKSVNPKSEKWIIYGSAAITFILFSFSGFQLPFYIVIIFPQFSIITAAYLTSLRTEASFKKIILLQNTLLIITGLFVVALAWNSGFGNVILIAIISVGVIGINFIFFRENGISRIITTGAAFAFVLFLFLHNFFYPNLLTYQSGMMAGKWLTANKNNKTSALFRSWSYSFEFYAPGYVQRLESFTDLDKFLEKDNRTIYTTTSNLQELKLKGYQYKVLGNFPDFHVSMLTARFLNPSTRPEELEQRVLITVQKQKSS